MSTYTNTVLSFYDSKEAALYFDHVIPIFIGLDFTGNFAPKSMKCLFDSANFQALKDPANPPIDSSLVDEMLLFIKELLPPDLTNNKKFINHYAKVFFIFNQFYMLSMLNRFIENGEIRFRYPFSEHPKRDIFPICTLKKRF